MFVHVVYFWLNEGIPEADRRFFHDTVSTLGNISALRQFQLGVPAATDRPVIDRSYDYSLLTVFEDLAGHDAYQTDPIHLEFVEKCSHLWSRVQIYDSVPAPSVSNA